MFIFEELSNLEKEFILLIGDDIKFPSRDPVFAVKNSIEIYNKIYKEKMSLKQYEDILTNLYYKGLISFIPANIDPINNTIENATKELEMNFDIEQGWRKAQHGVRLTKDNERTITGIIVYQRLLQDEINSKYLNLNNTKNELLKNYTFLVNKEVQLSNQYDSLNFMQADLNDIFNKLNDKVSGLEANLNQITSKIIEVMAIFIAIFIFIAGNSSLLVLLNEKPLHELISLTLIINGTIILSISFMLILVRELIFDGLSNNKYYFILIIPIIILLLGLIIA